MLNKSNLRSVILSAIRGGALKLLKDRRVKTGHPKYCKPAFYPSSWEHVQEIIKLTDEYGALTPTEIEWLLEDASGETCERCERLKELKGIK